MKIAYKPTIIEISKKLRQQTNLIHGEDKASLMFASIDTFRTQPQPKTKIQKILDIFRPKNQLILNLDLNENKNAVVTAQRKLHGLTLQGKTVEFPLESTLSSIKPLEKAILQSKEDILKEVSRINKYKKNIFLHYVGKKTF